jgi:histidinol-phosphate phosphatase family protein
MKSSLGSPFFPEAAPAVFLDRDGTIIEDRGFISDLDDIVFIAGAIESLRRLAARYALFIVTNQTGVGTGAIRRSQAESANRCVVERLNREGIDIREVYTCMHAKGDGCECMKPRPFFLLKAHHDFNVDLGCSYVIGDHPHDIAFARNAGATGLYVLSGHGQKHRGELDNATLAFPDIRAAAEYILKK